MKRLFIASLAFISVSSFGIFRIGPQGGLTTFNGSFSPSVTTTARTGFAAGVAAELGLGSDWHLQFEGLYIQKGYKATVLTIETTSKFDYWEFPILLKYVIDIPIIKPFLEAGPYFAIKLKSESTNSLTSTTSAISGVKGTDMGLSFGAGVDLSLSPVSSLFAVGRYDLGLTNILDTTTTTTVKLNGILVMAGLLFGF